MSCFRRFSGGVGGNVVVAVIAAVLFVLGSVVIAVGCIVPRRTYARSIPRPFFVMLPASTSEGEDVFFLQFSSMPSEAMPISPNLEETKDATISAKPVCMVTGKIFLRPTCSYVLAGMVFPLLCLIGYNAGFLTFSSYEPPPCTFCKPTIPQDVVGEVETFNYPRFLLEGFHFLGVGETSSVGGGVGEGDSTFHEIAGDAVRTYTKEAR